MDDKLNVFWETKLCCHMGWGKNKCGKQTWTIKWVGWQILQKQQKSLIVIKWLGLILLVAYLSQGSHNEREHQSSDS